jgi:hypothetical protein
MNVTDSNSATVTTGVMQPNEFDRQRVARAIASRKRYRYVSPSVHAVRDGYVIRSPCCSRNVDSAGGVVDVALLKYRQGPRPWALYRKEHDTGEWCLHAGYERLQELLEQLKVDPLRLFWQ